MKKLLFLVATLSYLTSLYAQDIDIYRHQQNDEFKMPDISWQMSFDEYQILSKHLRMQHMLYAMVLPGYAHFYVNEPTTGWILFTTRMAVYGSLLYTYYYAYQHRETATINQWLINTNVIWAEAGFIMANYFFDWIHARYKLEKKQQLIRYKYSMKLQLSAINSPQGKTSPSIGVRVNF